MSVEFKFKNAGDREETKERFALVEPYAKSDYDKEYLYEYFGCVPWNCRHPSNILCSCDTLSDYKFSDLFEEVNLSDVAETIIDETGWHSVYGKGYYGNNKSVQEYNVRGYYLILNPDGFITANTAEEYGGPNDTIEVLNDGTRLFKPKFEFDCSKYNDSHADVRLEHPSEFNKCLADIISANSDIYYHNDNLNDIINNMTIKFVPTNVINGKEIISASGLLAFRYNEVMG